MTSPKGKQEAVLPVHEGDTPPEGQESNMASPEDLSEEKETGGED